MGVGMGNTGIIGGGASGMMAAVVAASAGEKVTILERQDRIGKKLLATGNGRCNLSNRDFCVERDYRSQAPAGQLAACFSAFGVEETLSFFRERGLLTREKNGYLYPRSLQASAVLDFFRGELDRLAVRVVCSCTVTKIRKQKRFLVMTDQGEYVFDRLILACGSAAGTNVKAKLGGFELAKGLGLSVHEPFPSLVPLCCREPFFKQLAGVRCLARVSLGIYPAHAAGKRTISPTEHREMPESVHVEEGELQLTEYGISGIPVFQCSRYAVSALTEKKRVEAVIDFLPEYEQNEWETVCQKQYEGCLGKSVLLLGSGLLHKKIVQVLLSCCGLKPDEIVGERTRKRIFSMFAQMRAFLVQVTGYKPMENAQVCAGGVALSEVDGHMEVRKAPGLFLCGEMLDVDGRCGGYNLQWAWTSGYLAGNATAGRNL